MDSAKFSLNQEDRLLSQLLKVRVKQKRPKGIPLRKWSLSFTYLANTVPDPNLEIRRRGGSSRPLDKRGTRSFGPQFVPKIRGSGGADPLAPSPGSATEVLFLWLIPWTWDQRLLIFRTFLVFLWRVKERELGKDYWNPQRTLGFTIQKIWHKS